MDSDEEYSSDDQTSKAQSSSMQILQKLWNVARKDGDPVDIKDFLDKGDDDDDDDDAESGEKNDVKDHQVAELNEESKKMMEAFKKIKAFHDMMDAGSERIRRLCLFDYYMDYFEGSLNHDFHDPRIDYSYMVNYGYGRSKTHCRYPLVQADIADLAITNYDFTPFYNVNRISIYTTLNTVFSVHLPSFRLPINKDEPRQPIDLASSGLGSQKYFLNKTKDNVETDGNYDDSYNDHKSLKSLEVTKLEDVLLKGFWTAQDKSNVDETISFGSNTTVTYKDYIFTLNNDGKPALVITKMDPRTITSDVSNNSKYIGKWFIELFARKFSDAAYEKEFYANEVDRTTECVRFMKICQLGGRSKLFLCMAGEVEFNFLNVTEEEYGLERLYDRNPREHESDSCRIYDIEDLIRYCLEDDEERLKIGIVDNKIHYIQYDPQFLLTTYRSVWSCDTYDGEDFQIVALGTNERKVRLYYHSNKLSKEITGGKYFYKCFPIDFSSTIPTLSFDLNHESSKNVLLNVGTADGYVYKIKLDLEKELENLETFFPILDCDPETVSRELVDKFLLAQAVVRGAYEVYGKVDLGNCVWTITKLNGKTDFMPVKTWKDLTGCEFDDFNREKEHECIKTEFLLGSGFDPEIVETDDYNIGALMTTMAVPTFPLKKLYDNILRENDDKILFNQANFNFARVETVTNPDITKTSCEMGTLFNRNRTPFLLLDNGVMSVEHHPYNNAYVIEDIQYTESRNYEETTQLHRSKKESKIKFSKKMKAKMAAQHVLIDTSHGTEETVTEQKTFGLGNENSPGKFSKTDCYDSSYRIWNKNIKSYSSGQLFKLVVFFQMLDDLHAHTRSTKFYIVLRKIFKKLFENEHLVIDLNSSDNVDKDDEELDQIELIITFKQFEKDCLNVSNCGIIVDKLLGELNKPDIEDQIRFAIDEDYYDELFSKYDNCAWDLSKQENLFSLNQREKMTYLYMLSPIDKYNTKMSFSDNEYSFVTTENGIYLLHGQPLLVKAYTPNVIFDVTELCSPYHDYLVNLNRISISLHIKELCCVAVASQIGLVSIMRLTDYKGVKSFKQECILGLKVLKNHTPFLKHVNPANNTVFSSETYHNKGEKGSRYNQRLQDSNVDFPMAIITGLTYRMMSSNSCRLSVHSQNGTFHYKIIL